MDIQVSKDKILIADDEPDILNILKRRFELKGHEVITATNGEEALTKASIEKPNLILLDVMMPRMDGFEVCMRLRENRATHLIPIIMVTARDGIVDRITGMRSGADDYVTKPFDFRELDARVAMILQRSRRNISANPLTGLPGNISIEEEIKHRIERAQHTKTKDNAHPAGTKFAICYLDNDNFKAYNDNYGYDNGDKVIKMTANIIVEMVNKYGNEHDFIGHLGGDDFIFITTVDKVDNICAQIIDKFDRSIPLYYNAEDNSRSYIESVDRRGNKLRFPIMSISIAVITNEYREIKHYLQVNEIATELKKYAKSHSGSVYVKDKRRDTTNKLWQQQV